MELVSNVITMAGGCGGNQIESRGTVSGQEWTGDDYFDYSFAQGARTRASAAADLGVLHAFSYASATSTPAAYFYTSNSGESVAIDNVYRADAMSSGSASWYDQITVKQGAEYGRVVLKFSLTLTGSQGVTPGMAGSAGIGARFIVSDDRNGGRTLSLNSPGSTEFEAGYWPGTVITLYGDLSASTTVRAGGRYMGPYGWLTGNYIASAEATANASNTAGFLVQVVGDGSYTSDSGRSYVTAVPEPASAWLLGLGGLVMLRRLRRSR